MLIVVPSILIGQSWMKQLLLWVLAILTLLDTNYPLCAINDEAAEDPNSQYLGLSKSEIMIVSLSLYERYSQHGLCGGRNRCGYGRDGYDYRSSPICQQVEVILSLWEPRQRIWAPFQWLCQIECCL